MSRRVVITGVGAISGFGLGIDALWRGLVEGRSCLKRVTRLDTSGFRSKLAAEVGADFTAKDFVPKSYRKAVKVMARDIELAVGAARAALDDAKITTKGTLEMSGDAAGRATYPSERMGCHIGAGLIAADAEEMAAAMATAVDEGGKFSLRKWGGEGGGGMEALTPLWLLKYLPNMLACHVTIVHGCEGPSNTITCAEASGLLSIGESSRVIQRGQGGAADLCFSGGVESKLNVMGILRMDLAGKLAATGDETDGSKLVRPFDEGAAGGLVGEGGGILILEEAECAARRGAKIIAEIAGFGAGHSLCGSLGEPAGAEDEGYKFAILNALDDARMKPEQIDAIVPAAAGVKAIDNAEAWALREVFGSRLDEVPLVTVVPNIGNCMAGQGALLAAVGARCVGEGRLPARIHAGRPRKGLDAGASPSREAALRHVLVCTGSMGGQNAAVVLRKWGG